MRIFQQLKIVPDPVVGYLALIHIEKILQSYSAKGLLLGSMVPHIWMKSRERDILTKDLDVLILEHDVCRFPGQWEGGVDWWVSVSDEMCPNNGTHVGLRWAVDFESIRSLDSGLYLPTPRTMQAIHFHERSIGIPTTVFSDKVYEYMQRKCCPEVGIQVLSENNMKLKKHLQSTKVSLHPKKF